MSRKGKLQKSRDMRRKAADRRKARQEAQAPPPPATVPTRIVWATEPEPPEEAPDGDE